MTYRCREIRPYIGVTGFMSYREVQILLDQDLSITTMDKLLMVGVLASSKTLAGMKNRWPMRYPLVSQLGSVFLRFKNALNLIHFNTDTPECLVEQLAILSRLSGPDLHGFQLNMRWPDPRLIEEHRKKCEQHVIVLQVGGQAFRMIDNSGKVLVQKLKEYRGLVDYVLLDKSGGVGIPLDANFLVRHIHAIREAELPFRVGVAGGLSAENIGLIDPLVKVFEGLSFDAEGNLRDENDHLDLEKARAYVRAARERPSMG